MQGIVFILLANVIYYIMLTVNFLHVIVYYYVEHVNFLNFIYLTFFQIVCILFSNDGLVQPNNSKYILIGFDVPVYPPF